MLQIAKLDLNYKLQLLAYEYQTQSPRGVLRKRRPQKFRKIHRKIPLPESLFNKVAGISLATLLKKRLWHRWFPMNFAKWEHFFYRTHLLEFRFDLSSVISKVFFADHVFVFESLKNLTQQTNPNSKSTIETLIQDVKSVESWE